MTNLDICNVPEAVVDPEHYSSVPHTCAGPGDEKYVDVSNKIVSGTWAWLPWERLTYVDVSNKIVSGTWAWLPWERLTEYARTMPGAWRRRRAESVKDDDLRKYSGKNSTWFWDRVGALRDTSEYGEIYSLGVAIQNLEEQVLRTLINVEHEVESDQQFKAKERPGDATAKRT